MRRIILFVLFSKNPPKQAKPLITVKEARKLLGNTVKDTSDEELEVLLASTEEAVRLILCDHVVRKKRMI